MTIRIFIPRDAAAVACGADDVAKAVSKAAAKAKLDAQVVRNGSRGMLWLEPLMEIEDKGVRYAFGPMTEADASVIVASLAKTGASKIKHALALGPTEEIPFFKKQMAVYSSKPKCTDCCPKWRSGVFSGPLFRLSLHQEWTVVKRAFGWGLFEIKRRWQNFVFQCQNCLNHSSSTGSCQ